MEALFLLIVAIANKVTFLRSRVAGSDILFPYCCILWKIVIIIIVHFILSISFSIRIFDIGG